MRLPLPKRVTSRDIDKQHVEAISDQTRFSALVPRSVPAFSISSGAGRVLSSSRSNYAIFRIDRSNGYRIAVGVGPTRDPPQTGAWLMSIHAMIALHPDVGENFNQLLATAANHAMVCAEMCTSCADACTAEAMDMRQCIRSCLDCADICTATGRLAVRRTGQNIEVFALMLESCARVCELCADECSRYDHGHCLLCAEMCGECASDCRKALQDIR